MTLPRNEIYNKTNGHCAYCGEWINPKGRWEIDHIQPRSRGGSDKPINLILSCRTCNIKKRDKSSTEFRAWLLNDLVRRLNEIIEIIELFGITDYENQTVEYTSEIVGDLMNIQQKLDPDVLAEDWDGRSLCIKFMADSVWGEEWKEILKEFNNDPVKAILFYHSQCGK